MLCKAALTNCLIPEGYVLKVDFSRHNEFQIVLKLMKHACWVRSWPRVMATLPPGGPLITYQLGLLEGKECYISAVDGPNWPILWWMVGVGMSWCLVIFRN